MPTHSSSSHKERPRPGSRSSSRIRSRQLNSSIDNEFQTVPKNETKTRLNQINESANRPLSGSSKYSSKASSDKNLKQSTNRYQLLHQDSQSLAKSEGTIRSYKEVLKTKPNSSPSRSEHQSDVDQSTFLLRPLSPDYTRKTTGQASVASKLRDSTRSGSEGHLRSSPKFKSTSHRPHTIDPSLKKSFIRKTTAASISDDVSRASSARQDSINEVKQEVQDIKSDIKTLVTLFENHI